MEKTILTTHLYFNIFNINSFAFLEKKLRIVVEMKEWIFK